MAKLDKAVWAWLLLFIFGPGFLTAALWIISEGHHLSLLPLFIYSFFLVLTYYTVLFDSSPMECHFEGFIFCIIGICVLLIFGGKGLLWASMSLLTPILIAILLSIPFYFISFLQWLGEDKK